LSTPPKSDLDPAKAWPFPTGKRPAASDAITPPKLGQYWAGQGGIYIGRIITAGDGPDDFLVMATAEHGEHADVEWGKYGTKIEGASDTNNGRANTAAMAAAELELGTWARGLTIEGHSDFYLPAQDELALMYINGRQHCDKACYWSSTQYSADFAWFQSFAIGTQYAWDKDYESRARAVRRFSTIE
jgi:hypothetical protein